MFIVYHKGNNNLLADVFYLLEGVLLITFYYLSFKEKEFKIPSIILLVGYITFGIYTSFFDPGPELYNSTFRTGESLIIQALSGYSLVRISKQTEKPLIKNPEFWFSAGFFTYFSVGIAIFFTATFIFDESKHFMVKTWIIHSVVNIMANFVFAYGLFCLPSKKIS
jgi:tryptophan-rich sensory protein